MKRNITRLSVCITTFVLILGICACGQSKPSHAWQVQYDLGVRYLSEGNYEEAIISFTAAIEIDPKQPSAYISLANIYIDRGDFEAARTLLEQGYSHTRNAKIKKLMDGIVAQDASDVSSLNIYGVVEFSKRRWFVDANELSDEQTDFLLSAIAAVEREDRVALEALATRYSDLFPPLIYTQTEKYKVFMETWRGTSGWKADAADLRVELRPQTGTGYYAMVSPLEGHDALDEYSNTWVWGYTTCECKDWQPNGPFTQRAVSLDISNNSSTTKHAGFAENGVIVGEVSCQDSNRTYTNSYKDGHLILSDGPTEYVWGPLNLPGNTCHDADRLWW